MAIEVDVFIIGGGPASSTIASLLRRYDPSLSILIVEREVFPRDHIGESQLTAACTVLHEMGAWEKVEAAEFPVKIGSTYRWGKSKELWSISFLVNEEYTDIPRPAKYEGVRARTAFQVDRSVFDEILLDHAASVGCEVREGYKTVAIDKTGDKINSITIAPTEGEGPQEVVKARYYVDASGGSGFLRRAMGVEVDSPTTLRNVALYKYWRDTEWAVTVGNGGTRAQIMSIGWGWIWFIPIGKTRTSVGIVTPASYLKSCGKTPEQLYFEGLDSDPRIKELLANATQEETFYATKDWSYIADRLTGENWFLVGDACGFADPILSAGMTLAMVGARKAAYTILELDRGQLPAKWLKSEYSRSHRANILQHIRFGEFWYSANGQFSDLHDYCAEIADDAGLKLTPEEAFRWIGTGGFAADTFSNVHAQFTTFDSTRNLLDNIIGAPEWSIFNSNRFELNLRGAKREKVAFYRDAAIEAVPCWRRDEKVAPIAGPNELIFQILERDPDATNFVKAARAFIQARPDQFRSPNGALQHLLHSLENLISQGWITASTDSKRPMLDLQKPA